MTDAPFKYNTYDSLPEAPKFELTSTDIEDGGTMPPPQLSKAFGVEGGEDCSPQLSWSGFDTEKTKSFVVSCYDPDAPTVSGFWHWVVYDIPVSCTSLETDAGNASDKSKLPEGAKVLKNGTFVKMDISSTELNMKNFSLRPSLTIFFWIPVHSDIQQQMPDLPDFWVPHHRQDMGNIDINSL